MLDASSSDEFINYSDAEVAVRSVDMSIATCEIVSAAAMYDCRPSDVASD